VCACDPTQQCVQHHTCWCLVTTRAHFPGDCEDCGRCLRGGMQKRRAVDAVIDTVLKRFTEL
jgi:hypothetical protein